MNLRITAQTMACFALYLECYQSDIFVWDQCLRYYGLRNCPAFTFYLMI